MRWPPPRRSPTTARPRRVASQERAVPFIITVVAVVAVLTYGLLVPARPAGGRRRIIALGRRPPGAEHRRPRRAAGVVLGRPTEDHGVRNGDHSDGVVGRRSLQWTSWSYTALPAGQSAMGRVSSTETTFS